MTFSDWVNIGWPILVGIAGLIIAALLAMSATNFSRYERSTRRPRE